MTLLNQINLVMIFSTSRFNPGRPSESLVNHNDCITVLIKLMVMILVLLQFEPLGASNNDSKQQRNEDMKLL
jgi:hypothetical protein